MTPDAASSRVDGARTGLWRRYGAGPGHLVAVLGSFVLAGYPASRLLGEPVLLRIAVWFVGAAVVWDLLLGPLVALVDRGLRAVAGRASLAGVRPLNHVRLPLLLSGLLLLLFAPLVLRRSESIYAAKAGLPQDVYLGRWLAVTAVLCAASALAFAVRVLRARRGRHPDG
jgi:hypothetical protein